MWRRCLICAVAAGLLVGPELQAALDGLVRAGRWAEVLQLARLRSRQLPLQPGEAMVAAEAARRLDDAAARADFLELVLDDEGLGAVARVELAEILAGQDAARSVELALPLIVSAPTPEIRNAAATAAARAVLSGVEAATRQALQRAARSRRHAGDRELELALALTADAERDRALVRLLEVSSADEEALRAALALAGKSDLAAPDRWQVARTLYRHALYEQAEAQLAAVASTPHPAVPAWEVVFTSGRCAFRRELWAEAASRYRRAVDLTSSRHRRAELEVHLARALELAGDDDGGRQAARRALALQPSDDRRLLLLRLHLSADQLAEAEAVARSLRGRSAQDRGRVLLGLHHLRSGRTAQAVDALRAVRARPWRTPARVMAAGLAAQGDDQALAETLLDEALEPWMDWYWAAAARLVASGLDGERRAARTEELRRSTQWLEGDQWRRAAARWTVVETDQDQLDAASQRLAEASGLETAPISPSLEPGVAASLWRLGLAERAVLWDPGGLPRSPPSAALWTAQRLIEAGRGREASRVAERVREQVAPELPWWALPESLRRTLFPLPLPESVASAASEHRVPWALLAAMAHVESRWEPGALSVVGARGLTQLMPSTATRVARSVGVEAVAPEELFDPVLSLRLGAAELARLLECFGGRRAPAVAAYNAGEAQARLWLQTCGDRCSEEAYVLTISFEATRGYTCEVLAAAAAYESLHGERMKALLRSDRSRSEVKPAAVPAEPPPPAAPAGSTGARVMAGRP